MSTSSTCSAVLQPGETLSERSKFILERLYKQKQAYLKDQAERLAKERKQLEEADEAARKKKIKSSIRTAAVLEGGRRQEPLSPCAILSRKRKLRPSSAADGDEHGAPERRCLFVGNLPWEATDEEVVKLCEDYGPVVSFHRVVDKATGRPKAYGFAEFRDEETALSAQRNQKGMFLRARQLCVKFADRQSPSPWRPDHPPVEQLLHDDHINHTVTILSNSPPNNITNPPHHSAHHCSAMSHAAALASAPAAPTSSATCTTTAAASSCFLPTIIPSPPVIEQWRGLLGRVTTLTPDCIDRVLLPLVSVL